MLNKYRVNGFKWALGYETQVLFAICLNYAMAGNIIPALYYLTVSIITKELSRPF